MQSAEGVNSALNLHELEAGFGAAIAARRNWREPFSTLQPALQGDTAQMRFEIYRDNVRAVWRSAMDNVFPVVRQLVGDEFFGGLCHEYAAAHPSRSGDLNQFGAQFPAFLRTFPPAAELPYLPEVAQLEWAVQRAYYAADGAPLQLAAASGVTTLAMMLFRLHPSASLLQGKYAAAAIWLAHQKQPVTLAGINLEITDTPNSHYGLVWRHGFRTRVEVLSEGSFVLLQALGNGQTIGEALASALAAVPTFQLGDEITGWLSEGVLISA